MSCINSYKKRVGFRGVTDTKSRIVYEARKNFERSLLNDPSSIIAKITDVGEINISENTKSIPCIINDFSENDQKTFDEKVLYVKHDENVGLGSYVEYDNFIWLVIFREHRAANVYKSFIMRKCNQILKYEYENEIYDIPCVVRNLTQYSDGLQDIVYTSIPDARRSIMYSQNEITSKIELGHRFLINHRGAYRVTHIQDFEYQNGYSLQEGITTCIAVHTALRDSDDTENNLAHNEKTSNVKTDEDTILVGSSKVYSIDEDYSMYIDYTSSAKEYVQMSTNNGKCELTLDMNFDLIGETFMLIGFDIDNNVVLKKNITVVGFM